MVRTNEQKEKRALGRQKVCGRRNPGRKARTGENWALNLHQVERACDQFWQERGMPEPQHTIQMTSTGHYWSTPTAI